jgi:hypothetical protein
MGIKVSDPFSAASDSQLAPLALALDPAVARKELKRGLPLLSGVNGKLRLQAIRVTRHKPGRRCVVEYDVQLEQPQGPPSNLTMIGKIRAHRFGNESFRLLQQVWQAGFDEASPDGIAVPEPLGVIPLFQMWFQRKVPGRDASGLIAGPDGARLARRLAEAAHKLHLAGIPTERAHRMEDELRILRESLGKVAELEPEWEGRLVKLAEACVALAAKVPAPHVCGIHRDFYPAQVVVDGLRIYLLDFDLYCIGDPALDVGNFLGHLTEQALREYGNPEALSLQESALRERFLELYGESHRTAVEAYTTLTLARHVYLSTRLEDRRALTEALLELCESRVASAR